MVEEDGGGGSGDGLLDIGVWEDDGRGLSAQLEGDFLQIAGRGFHDQLADFGRSGKGDLVDQVMRGERRSGAFAVAGEDVDHALGEAGFHEELGQAQPGERGLLGQLEDDGIAGRQGRAQLPGSHQQREVPGDDLADDADGLAQGVGKVVAGERNGEGAAGDLGGPSGHVAEEVDGERNVGGAGHGQRLAVVHGFELGKFFEMLLQQVGEFVEQPAALRGGDALGGELAPGALVKGATGGADGTVDIGGFGFGNVSHYLSGGRIVDGKGLAGGGVDELAVDEHAVIAGDEL